MFFVNKNQRKHFESVNYCLIIVLIAHISKFIIFEQRLHFISQVSKSAPSFFLNAPGFQSVGEKLPPKKHVNVLPCV